MDKELERKLLVLEPSLRLRAKPVEREMYLWFVVDTSASMFDHIGESLNIDLSTAVELAISSALSLLAEIAHRYGIVNGYFAFFSAKDEDFKVDGDLLSLIWSSASVMAGEEVDVFKLIRATAGGIETLIAAGKLNIKIPSGGTDPNPLLAFLAELGKKEYERDPDAIYIFTDGFIEDIKVPVPVPTYVYIVPGGTKDVKVVGASRVEIIGLSPSSI
jgi:hypothetical protein